MELEELQKAWKELNERVSQNELVHQQQIIENSDRKVALPLKKTLSTVNDDEFTESESFED